MRRVISVYLPTWPTDRLRRSTDAWPPDRPLVLAARDGTRRIAAADAQAQALGLWPGLAVAQAQAMVPQLIVADAAPDADAAALRDLAQWAAKRFSPWVAVCEPDGLWIEAAGCAHLFGGEARMLRTLVRQIERGGMHVRAAVADTPGAAHAVARFAASRSTVIPVGSSRNAVGSFPVAALRLPPPIAEGLRRLGLERIGQLYGMARAPLARRFGTELFRRLDQALGDIPEPIDPVVAPAVPRSSVRLAEPVTTADALVRLIERLTVDLCLELDARRCGARRLDLRFLRVDGGVQAIAAGTAKASRTPTHLAKLLVMFVETVDPGFGIEAATLVATVTEPLAAEQLGAIAGDAPEPDLAELIDRLANRLGDRRLYRLMPVESDVPERSVRRVPALAPPSGQAWPYADARPALLLDPPEAIHVTALLPDHPPRQFQWRGQHHRIVRADGPEVVHGEWWRADAEVAGARDYFAVEDSEGRRFWVFRRRDEQAPDGTPMRWYMHGLFG